MASFIHELWEDPEGLDTFVLSGPSGNKARAPLSEGSRLVWSVEAGSHYEAMTKYYAFRGWGSYTTEHEWDHQPYPDDFDEVE